MERMFVKLTAVENITPLNAGWYGNTYASTGVESTVSCQPHGNNAMDSVYKAVPEEVCNAGWYGNTYASTGVESTVSCQPHGIIVFVDNICLENLSHFEVQK